MASIHALILPQLVNKSLWLQTAEDVASARPPGAILGNVLYGEKEEKGDGLGF